MIKQSTLLLALSFFGSFSYAQPHFVTGSDYLPYTDENTLNGGLITDLIRSAYRSANTDIVVDFLPWKRGYVLTQRGEFDATFPYIQSDDRSAEFYFSIPIIESENILVGHPDIDLADQDSWNQVELCQPVGYHYPLFQELEAQGRASIVEPDNYSQCLKLLLAKRADITFSGSITHQYNLQQLGIKSTALQTLAYKAHSSDSLHVIFPKSKGYRAVVDFNKMYSQFKNTDAYQQVLNRHLNNSPENPTK